MTTEITKHSRPTRAAIDKHGLAACVKAYRDHLKGEGADYCGGYRGLRIGDAMINAGREIETGSREPGSEPVVAAVVEAAPVVEAPAPGSIVYSCAGYDIVAPDPRKVWKAGEEFAIGFQSRHYGTLYRFYQLGSVVSYAMKNGSCPVAALDRARAHGHELHFAFALSTILSDPPQAKHENVGLAFGDTIKFEGRTFRLEPANNDNVKLVEVQS
jgi:hypothetical protein